MYICTCNYCGNLWEDTNPDLTVSIDYPEQKLESLADHKCPECMKDDYLVDNINFLATGELPAIHRKNALQAAIAILKKEHPEFEEEHTTGWDMMQTLEAIINSF